MIPSACSSRGVTLIELVVALAILVALGGIALYALTDISITVGDEKRSSRQIATEASMSAIRDAILGTSAQNGYFQDLGQDADFFPEDLAALFEAPESLPEALRSFDPERGTGWMGPYLTTATGVFPELGSAVDGYGVPGDPTMIDAWGNPIIIQRSTDQKFSRLVSLGENGFLDTPQNVSEPTQAQRGDDLLAFFFVSDPNP